MSAEAEDPTTPNDVARARTLERAMKGWGTDEATLINVAVSLRPEEIAPLNLAYNLHIGGDVIENIRKETSGQFEDALVALFTPVAKYDAQLCNKALKGFGTNEQLLIEVLCTRSLEELKELSNDYFRAHIRFLDADLKAKVDGDFCEILFQRLAGTEEKGETPADVECLFAAGQKKEVAPFISILCHRSREYLQQLNTAYANEHGVSLATAIDDIFSGDVKKALILIVTPPADYFAELLYKAMKGFGTDDATLIRVIASQRFRHLKEIAAVYLDRYGVSLKQAVANELSGDYKKLILALLEYVLEGQVPAVL